MSPEDHKTRDQVIEAARHNSTINYALKAHYKGYCSYETALGRAVCALAQNNKELVDLCCRLEAERTMPRALLMPRQEG